MRNPHTFYLDDAAEERLHREIASSGRTLTATVAAAVHMFLGASEDARYLAGRTAKNLERPARQEVTCTTSRK